MEEQSNNVHYTEEQRQEYIDAMLTIIRHNLENALHFNVHTEFGEYEANNPTYRRTITIDIRGLKTHDGTHTKS